MENQTPESAFLRRHAEQLYAGELEALRQQDTRPRPVHWERGSWNFDSDLYCPMYEDYAGAEA